MAGFLAGKVVVVTGGGGGIGRAVVLPAAAEGAKVLVADYGVGMAGEDPSSEVADAVVTEITKAGGEAIAVADDISKMESGERLIATAAETMGPSTAWCPLPDPPRTHAVQHERGRLGRGDRHPPEGHFTVFRAAAAVMRKQEAAGADRVHLGRLPGSVAQANYAAAKGGIVSLVRRAALGLHRYGVTANAVAPVARTRMSASVPSRSRMGEPEDVAPMVVFLLRDTASRSLARSTRCGVQDRRMDATRRGEGHLGRRPLDARADRREKLDGTVGQERMWMIDRLEQMRTGGSGG